MVAYDLVWLIRLLVGVLLFRLLCADYGFDTVEFGRWCVVVCIVRCSFWLLALGGLICLLTGLVIVCGLVVFDS